MISSASIHLVGIVKAVLVCSVTQLSPTKYQVHEVSNTRSGYEVDLITDEDGTYNKIPFQANGIIITNVTEQTESIDTIKILEFASPPSVVSVSCRSHE